MNHSGVYSSKLAFKPFGKPPLFDFEEYKDSFQLWYKKWEFFVSLSTIDTELEEDARGF